MIIEEWSDVVGAERFGVLREIRRVDETGSTNADLLSLARDGEPEGIVLVAEHQTAGRGRLGRAWQAPPGSSLLVSILLRPQIDVDDWHLATTALGVAAAEACRYVGVDAKLKWPNDLVLTQDPDPWSDRPPEPPSGSPPGAPPGPPPEPYSGLHPGATYRKLGGMLAESLAERERLVALVVGIGINVNWPPVLPDELAEVAIALSHAVGSDVSRPALLAEMLERFEIWYRELTSGVGRGRLLDRYRELSATVGQNVRIDLGTESVLGEAIGIDDRGRLVVQEGSSGPQRSILAGDVVHLRPSH